MLKKLSSLTIFFPFYNDAGTVEKQIDAAYKIGKEITDDLEVIAIHGGNSKDDTLKKIENMKKKYPKLVVMDKFDNTEGYAVIKHGFKNATKDWVFYTDGDAQYHLESDLIKLVKKQTETNADAVNGYKTARGDSFVRKYLGIIYAKLSNFIFELPIRDTDCDFRLIRKSSLDKIQLISNDSSILPELVKKLELAGIKFAEIPVSHFNRIYGQSNYTPFTLLKEKLIGDLALYFKLRKMKKSEEKLRVLKFITVGIYSVTIQFILFNIFIALFSINPASSIFISDQFAIITAFLLNNYMTFRYAKASNARAVISKFAGFYFTVIISTAMQTFIVYLGTGMFGKGIMVANAFFTLGIFVGFFWNYSIQSRIIWKRKLAS